MYKRQAFADELLELARKDQGIMLVATDSRGSAVVGEIAQALPEQFLEMGIAEQDAVGAAAGLALTGKNVFVCGPACFLAMRSAEQVRIDVAYSHTNVKIVGVSAGVSYGSLGSTHHTTQDFAVMRTLPGMLVLCPSDGRLSLIHIWHAAGWGQRSGGFALRFCLGRCGTASFIAGGPVRRSDSGRTDRDGGYFSQL